MRYECWARRVDFDDNVIKNRRLGDLIAKEPQVNQVLLQSSGDTYRPFTISTARPEVAELVAQQKRQQDLQFQEFSRKQQLIHQQQQQLEDQRSALLQQQQEQQYQQQQMLQLQLQHQQQQQYQQQALLYQIKQQKLLAQQQASKNGTSVASADHQATIQSLLLELAKINPQLALQTLQQFKQDGPPTQQQLLRIIQIATTRY